MPADDKRWTDLETWLRRAFGDLMRKGGTEKMVEHSIRIGRALRQGGEDDITVFGGYCHDVFEDVPDYKQATPAKRHAMLLPVALDCLGDAASAGSATKLVEACSYSDAEYLLAKDARKVVACARWLGHEDIRVLLVKKADVEDNRADCHAVSADFAAKYEAWAVPLHAGLCERIAALQTK